MPNELNKKIDPVEEKFSVWVGFRAKFSLNLIQTTKSARVLGLHYFQRTLG
ncbi:MAG: hypothetical protein V5A76_06090 [Candidatus Thermoplasmatota archaeon]